MNREKLEESAKQYGLVNFKPDEAEASREFAMALIDYGQQIRKRSKWKPFKGKEIKLFLQKKVGKQ